MFGKALNYLALLFCVPWTILMSTIAVLVAPFSKAAGFWCNRTYARGLCVLLGFKITYKGFEKLPKNHAVVLAPNHCSLFDIPILASIPFNFRWIAKIQLIKVPFLGWAMRAVGTYLVKRDQSGSDLNVMKEVEQGLRSGISVAIFPEGTRTRTGELLPFKKGAFRTAQNAQVPILPIAMFGTWEIAPPGKLPSRRGQAVTVIAGDPFTIPPGADLLPYVQKCRESLLALIAKGP